MEVRVRALAEQPNKDSQEFWLQPGGGGGRTMDSDLNLDHHHQPSNQSRFMRRIKHELTEMKRVTCNLVRCQASKFSYLFIPAFISIFWILIMLITTRNPNVTLEERYVRVIKSSFFSALFFCLL